MYHVQKKKEGKTMKEKLYLTDDIAIVNFDLAYPTSLEELVSSNTLSNFTMNYLEYLNKEDKEFYNWIVNGKSAREANVEVGKVFRQLMVLKPAEIESYYLNDKDKLLAFASGLYDFWKCHQRYSVTINRFSGMSTTPFVVGDSNFNATIRSTYRKITQSIIGKKNNVYRQLQAGTNAAIACFNSAPKLGAKYSLLNEILYIESVMLRTPMILQPKSNKRSGMFTEVKENPIEGFVGNADEFFCYPAKVGALLINVYFHRDFMSSGAALANLFELATPDEVKKKPDAIVLFGSKDGKNETNFFYDEEEDMYVGCISYDERIEYFGYMKKMTLTLHNCVMMRRNWLPIHGAFINVTLKDGKRKGIMLMGDSGAGKSESIEALKTVGKAEIKNVEIVFDDMGTVHVEDGVPYAQGTEIGAFIRLDDLDAGTPYRDMDRSIFFNPDSSNARVITPAAPYSVVASNHKIDLFCYANNYDTIEGMRKITDVNEAKPIFIEGKRMAKGTTQEVGISTTYFANPFGPMQQQEICDPIIDEMFDALYSNGTYIGEIFTHLGLDKENRSGIHIAAKELLKFIEKN